MRCNLFNHLAGHAQGPGTEGSSAIAVLPYRVMCKVAPKTQEFLLGGQTYVTPRAAACMTDRRVDMQRGER